MPRDATPKTIRLAEDTPPPFSIERVTPTFDLDQTAHCMDSLEKSMR